MAIHTAGLPEPFAAAAPASFFVLGMGEGVHSISLALMACLRGAGFRITGLMPLAHDAQWQQGRWRSERVLQLRAASSFDFPASALCTAPTPDPAGGARLTMHLEAVADSYAALATWADIVVIDGEGDPDASLAPGVTLGDMAQTLGLPVILVCEDNEVALQAACELVLRCRARGIQVVGWVQAGERPLACAAGIPRIGAIPRWRPVTSMCGAWRTRCDRTEATAPQPMHARQGSGLDEQSAITSCKGPLVARITTP